MKTTFRKTFHRSVSALGCALAWAAFTNGAGAATTPDPSVFGYANMRGLNPHPTLVVLVDFGDTPTVTFDTNQWDHFVFDTNDAPVTVNGYYNDVSAGHSLEKPQITKAMSVDA